MSLNNKWERTWAAIFGAGVVIWVLSLVIGDPYRAWRAFLISFIYFTPLTAGMVTWPAVLMLTRGEAMEPVKRPALIAVAFAPISLIAYLILWVGYPYWAAWTHIEHLPQGLWLNAGFVFLRDGVALAIFWGLAAVFVSKLRTTWPKALGGWLVFTYCIVMTLIAFDMVMALDPHWFSTLFGGYFFISGMYTAVAGWTISSIFQRPPVEAKYRADLGKLIVAFSLLTTYMMFCQLIPIWYENLPREVRFVIPRLRLAPWRFASLALLCTVYLGPLILLLVSRSKMSIRYLGAITLLVLAGMWLERWWLITPTLSDRMTLGFTEIAAAAAFLAALILAAGRFNQWLAPVTIREEIRELEL